MKESVTAYIGLGSNIGNGKENCTRALELIRGLEESKLKACSQWFLTRPIGPQEQDWYVNGVASVVTGLPPIELLNRILGIENRMGRVREERWGPRIIDLDLLLYGNQVVKEETLIVPHPRMHERRFVLIPLLEIAPGLVHPIFGKAMKALLEGIEEDGQEVVKTEE